MEAQRGMKADLEHCPTVTDNNDAYTRSKEALVR